jgi:hypothetical protein
MDAIAAESNPRMPYWFRKKALLLPEKKPCGFRKSFLVAFRKLRLLERLRALAVKSLA